MSVRARLAIIALAAWLGACDQKPLKAPPGSFVKIVSVSPDTKSPLKVGAKVKLQVEVSYALTVDVGQITLVVQAADNATLANHMAVVKKGNGKITLSTEFVVPDSNAVQIFTPLSAQGQTATSTVDHRAYKVVK
ncbi:MAG TPA: hypothetical protein VNC62_03240 [Burkholderiales bacterium]|jgi:hypothetical protein|nr:hypothetical protein [Burkholderiales bacterium]